jgi:hypothetical protein
MIDLRCERRIDVRKRLAGGDAAGSRGENLAVIRLQRRSAGRVPREDLLADFGDESV